MSALWNFFLDICVYFSTSYPFTDGTLYGGVCQKLPALTIFTIKDKVPQQLKSSTSKIYTYKKKYTVITQTLGNIEKVLKCSQMNEKYDLSTGFMKSEFAKVNWTNTQDKSFWIACTNVSNISMHLFVLWDSGMIRGRYRVNLNFSTIWWKDKVAELWCYNTITANVALWTQPNSNRDDAFYILVILQSTSFPFYSSDCLIAENNVYVQTRKHVPFAWKKNIQQLKGSWSPLVKIRDLYQSLHRFVVVHRLLPFSRIYLPCPWVSVLYITI